MVNSFHNGATLSVGHKKMMLIPFLLLALAFNGGLYLGTILFSAYHAATKSKLFYSEEGFRRGCC